MKTLFQLLVCEAPKTLAFSFAHLVINGLFATPEQAQKHLCEYLIHKIKSHDEEGYQRLVEKGYLESSNFDDLNDWQYALRREFANPLFEKLGLTFQYHVEAKSIATGASNDGCQAEDVKFTLKGDQKAGVNPLTGHVAVNQGIGLEIYFDGYSDMTSEHGSPVYIEQYDGELRVIVHSDINKEDPTHDIKLNNARIEHRRD